MDYEHSKEYTLSIRLMPDGFSFSIYNINEENSFMYEKQTFGSSAGYLAALEEGILSREELLLPFRSVNIIVASPRFSLVPVSFYSESESDKLYHYLISDQQPEKILCDHLEQTGAICLYGIEESVFAFLNRTFAAPVFHHHLGILSEYFILKSKMGNYDKMICQLRDGMLDMLCFSKGKLRMMNTFSYRHNNDIAYYILSAWKSLNMNAHTDSLQLTGDQQEIGKLTLLLNTYIASITPVVFPAQIFNLGKESMHAPFDLIALPLCV